LVFRPGWVQTYHRLVGTIQRMTVSRGTWLFDLDGTLIDSQELILDSFRYATRTVLGAQPDDDELRRGIGQPLIAQMRSIAPARADELFDVYVAHNRERTADLLRSYPGVPEMLDRLSAVGRRLGVVTSKMRPSQELAFRTLDIKQAFEVIVTVEDTPLHKPHPEPILHALELMGADAADTVYVGDSPFDMRAARAAGVLSAAATWGIFTREELEAEEPDVFYASPDEVAA
jgi:pyrophosphatase PpaX